MKSQYFFLLLMLVSVSTSAQYAIEPPKGYSHDIGNMVSMIDNLKERVERNVTSLDQEGTDFLLDENANSARHYLSFSRYRILLSSLHI